MSDPDSDESLRHHSLFVPPDGATEPCINLVAMCAEDDDWQVCPYLLQAQGELEWPSEDRRPPPNDRLRALMIETLDVHAAELVDQGTYGDALDVYHLVALLVNDETAPQLMPDGERALSIDLAQRLCDAIRDHCADPLWRNVLVRLRKLVAAALQIPLHTVCEGWNPDDEEVIFL